MMPDDTHVGFVRAVMQGRDGLHREVLLDAFLDAGATDVVSYITTGNVSFRAPATAIDEIQDAVEARLEEIVGRRTELFVRSRAELDEIRRRDPFHDAPLAGEFERVVTFLPGAPPDDPPLPIRSPGGDVVVFGTGRRELFTVATKVDGQSRGPGGLIERALGQRVTSRAWSTVERILTRLG